MREESVFDYFTANAFNVDVTVAGRNPNAPAVFAVPVADPFSNVPADGVSVTLHVAVPTQLMLVVLDACMIVPNLPLSFCVWLNAMSIPMTPCAEHCTVPVTVAAPLFESTATLGSIASVTVANRSSSNAPMSQVTP